MNRVVCSPQSLYWYGIKTKSSDVMFLDGKGNPKQHPNPNPKSPSRFLLRFCLYVEQIVGEGTRWYIANSREGE